MAKKSDEPLRKHTLLLFDGDFERLQNLFPDIGAAIVIRRLVRDYLKRMQPDAKIKSTPVDL